MKSGLLSIALLSGFLTLSTAHAGAADEPTLQVSVLQGTVLEKSVHQTEWSRVERVLPATGTWLKTEAGSSAVVELPDRTQLRLGESTQLQVTSIASGTLACRVEQGRVFAAIDGKSVVTVDAPHASVTARSGSFILDVSGSQAKLRVLDGNAQLNGPSVHYPQFRPLPAVASLNVPAGLDAVALDAAGSDVAAAAAPPPPPPPTDPNQFSPGSTDYNPGGQYGEFDTSAGQDEVKQVSFAVVPFVPVLAAAGGSVLPIVGGGLAAAGAASALALGGSDSRVGLGTQRIGHYVAPPPPIGDGTTVIDFVDGEFPPEFTNDWFEFTTFTESN